MSDSDHGTSGSGRISPVYGQEDTSSYPSASFTIASGDLITSAVLYGNGKGEWLGHIHLETSSGKTFDAGRDTNKITPYGIQVGGGLLYGANIKTHAADKGPGEDISSLGLLFLGQPIDHIAVTDITFSSDPTGTSSGISPQNVVVGQWYNGANSTVGYSLTPTYAVTQSYV